MVTSEVTKDDIHALEVAVSDLRERIRELQEQTAVSSEAMAVKLMISSANSTSIDEEDGDGGSIAFLMFCTILVLLMTTPGIMLYYSGLVRLQNALSTAIQAYVIASVITFMWLCFGYTICFGKSSIGGVIGTFDKIWLTGVDRDSYEKAPMVPEYVFCSYQLAFAIITPSLICGAFANRMKFWAVVVFLSSWHLIVYCPIVHCFWHPDGFLARWGVQDFAGGCVVHISAGFSSLISALMVGRRKRHKRIRIFHPHNKIISATGECAGCCLLILVCH